MQRTRPPRNWRLLKTHARRSPEWLSNRYKNLLLFAAARAWANRGRYSEPVRSLLGSIDVVLLSDEFTGKAVVSFRAPPFKGGLYQAYSWPTVIFCTPKELSRDIISSLVLSLREKGKRKTIAALAATRAAGDPS